MKCCSCVWNVNHSTLAYSGYVSTAFLKYLPTIWFTTSQVQNFFQDNQDLVLIFSPPFKLTANQALHRMDIRAAAGLQGSFAIVASQVSSYDVIDWKTLQTGVSNFNGHSKQH